MKPIIYISGILGVLLLLIGLIGTLTDFYLKNIF